MTKYRVVQISKNRFKPQWKGWFFWHNFSRYIVGPYPVSVICNSLDEAQKVIDKHIDEHEREKYPKVVATW